MSDKKDKDLFEELGEGLGKTFTKAVDTAKAVRTDVVDTIKEAKSEVTVMAREAANDLRDGINLARDTGAKGYRYVEENVGKDRLAGMALGAKLGGLHGVKGGVAGIGAGAIVGGVIGLVAGRKLFEWLDKGRSNDNVDTPQAPPENKPGGPSGPAP